MKQKKASLEMFDEIHRSFKDDEDSYQMEKVAVRMCLRVPTREQKMREARKTLYLSRYE